MNSREKIDQPADIAPTETWSTIAVDVLPVLVLSITIAGCGGSALPGVSDLPDARDMATLDACGDRCEPPSCAGPRNNMCGQDSCCASLRVTGGTFFRSYDGTNDYPDKSSPATVSDFRLDKYEITVGRFRAFVESGPATRANPPAAGAGAHPLIPGSGWDPAWNVNLAADVAALKRGLNYDGNYHTWTDLPGRYERIPINLVTWFEVFAFCAWDGGWVPTEAEWNYAACGGSEQRAYPWGGDGPNSSQASFYCDGDLELGCSIDDIRGVGSYLPPGGRGGSRWGQADLMGNLWEWNLDWTDGPPDYKSVKLCIDCANLTAGADRRRSVRGGAFDSLSIRAGLRSAFSPAERDRTVGGRCARRP